MKKNNALAHVDNKLVFKTCCYFIQITDTEYSSDRGGLFTLNTYMLHLCAHLLF